MSIDTIRSDIRSDWVTFGPHLVERMWENGLAIEQVLHAVLDGVVRKKERDRRSQGKFVNYTISTNDIAVVVKDCRPPFIITANKR